MGPIAAGIGAVTGTVGAIDSKNQGKADSAASAAAAAAQQQVAQQLETNVTNQTNQYNDYYSQALTPLSSGLMGEGNVSAANAGTLASQLQSAGSDPSSLAALTGVNSLDPTQAAISYNANPSATNLSGATGSTNGFYSGEMQNGINPLYAQNAQNQVQQTANSQIQNAMASAQPGQNVNALTKDINNQALTSSTNLAGNLAGQNQAIQQNGAAGLLGSAANLDTQKAGMLQNAANGATTYNQTALGNLQTSSSDAQSILGALQSYLGQGQGTVNSANNSLSSLMSSFGATSANDASAASAANGAAGNSLNSAASSLASLFPQNPSTSTSSYAALPMDTTSSGGYIAGDSNGSPDGSTNTWTQSTAGSPLASSAPAQAATPSALPPLSYSQPQSGMFTNALFTAPTQVSGGNYTA